MTDIRQHLETPYVIDPERIETLDVLGPTVQVLTPPLEDDAAPCLLRGTVPPGGVIPMHAHPDPETFIIESGEIEGLVDADGPGVWRHFTAGQIVHVPPSAKHAWRNPARTPVVTFIIATAKLARFFREIGTPARPHATAAPPSPDLLRRFQSVAERYGYWNAPPEDNARVGITMPW